MNEEDLKDRKEENESLKSGPSTEDRQKRKKICWVFVFLCLFAVIQILIILRMDATLLASDEVLDRWIDRFYFPIIPLTLVGVACGLPYYRNKEGIILGLLLNVFFWMGGLFAMFCFFRRL